MFVDQLSASPHHRLNQILHTLKHVHECVLPVNDPTKLQAWADKAAQARAQIVETQTFNSYMQQPAYVKASLILEAVKMLTEVAPRRRKTVKEHEEVKKTMLNEGKQKPDFLDVDKDGDRKEPMKQAAQQAKHKKLDEKKGAKPDFLDVDKDGDHKESMKKALADKKSPLKEFDQPKAIQSLKMINMKGHEGAEPFTYKVELNGECIGWVGHAGDAWAYKPCEGKSYRAATHDWIYKAGKSKEAAARALLAAHRGKMETHHVLREDQNLDKAQTLLAAKDISDRLQGMAEDAAKMAVDDLMPLVDTMKDQFGLEAATAFNNVVKQQLQTVLDSIIAAKDQTDNAINTMESGGMPAAQADIGQPLPPMGGAADGAPAAEPDLGADAAALPAEPGAEGGEGGDIDFEKEFAASPATSGPEEAPLGRAKKEVAEATTLTPAQQKAQADLAKHAAGEMVKTRKKPDGTMATSQEIADAKKIMTEKLTKKMSSSDIISDFVHSDDAKFKGKSKAERTQMALGAYYSMHPEKKLKESAQQVRQLQAALVQAKATYLTHVSSLKESWIQQQGDLQSAVLASEVHKLRDQLHEAVESFKQHKQELAQHNDMISSVQGRINQLQEQIARTPYGVQGEFDSGIKFRKLFETAELRETWVRYNENKINMMQEINQDDLQQQLAKLNKLV